MRRPVASGGGGAVVALGREGSVTKQPGAGEVAGVVAAAGALAWSWSEAARGVVGPSEARVFAAVNELPHALAPPVSVVMQAGNALASVVAGGLAAGTGRPRLGLRLVVGGTATWALCKVVKRRVGRGRPAAALSGGTLRGRPQSGLGFPSGHAGVAATLAGIAGAELGPSWGAGLWSTTAVVGVARIYVGAHLPHDVVGGIALGSLVAAIDRRWGPPFADAVIGAVEGRGGEPSG